MKKICILFLFILLLAFHVTAFEAPLYYWSLGEIGFSFDILNDNFEPAVFVNAGNLNWMTTAGLGFGFNFMNFILTENAMTTQILPVEVNFSPIRNNFFLTLYGRAAWQMSYFNNYNATFAERSSFYAAAGIRLAWSPIIGKSWSIFNGVYIEYNNKREVRVGIFMDLAVWTLLTALYN